MTRFKSFIFYITSLIFLSNSVILGQNFSIKSFVNDNQIQSSEYIKYTIETNKKVNVNAPELSDFSIVQGPYSSSSSSVSIVNGKIDRSETYTITYLLAPNKSGELVIPPSSADFDGKVYETQPIQISVGKSTTNNKANRSSTTNSKNSNLFAKINLSKSTALMGENILVTYKIYTRYSRMQIIDYDFPMTNGFWTEEIKAGANGWPQKQEVINGMPYNVITLKKEIISPQKTGSLIIPPIEIKALLNQDFFNRGYEKTFKSNSVKINVKPFPKGAPSSFSDQVGKQYKLKVNYSTNILKVDDPLDVTIEVSGNGNLKQLKLPSVKYPSDFEIFPEENKEKIKVSSNGISGKKIKQQLLIPRHHGEFEIPEIQFTYFDLNTKSYKTLKHPAFTLNVEKSDGTTAALSNIRMNNQEDVVLLNENIRHIHSNSQFSRYNELLFGTSKFYILLSSPLLGFLLLLLLLNYRSKNEDPSLQAKKKAKKDLEKNIENAQELLSSNKTDEFYQKIYGAWIEYLSIKFDLTIASLNKQTIENTLEKFAIPNDIISILTKILEECELAQYAPIPTENAQKTLLESKTVINDIEEYAKA